MEHEMATGKIMKSPFDDAELYDIVFGDFAFDRDFYLELARGANGPVLEVACGTGRILIPCMQAGVDIDGLDLYSSMIEVLRRKASALGLHPGLYVTDASIIPTALGPNPSKTIGAVSQRVADHIIAKGV